MGPFEPVELEQIWNVLCKPVPKTATVKAMQMFTPFVEKGWAYSSDIDDLLDYLDNRLTNSRLNLEDTVKRLGFHWQDCFPRPKSYSTSVLGNRALRVDEVCGLLMLLERLGFNIDAGPFVNSLKQKIRKTALLSVHETDIFFYKELKNKTAPIILSTSENFSDYWTHDTENVTTNSGYTVIKYVSNGAEVKALEFIAPKQNRRKLQIAVTCDVCGYEWQKGNRESSYCHRLEHDKRLKYLDPAPSNQYINASQSDSQANFVNFSSEFWKLKEVYLRAKAFRREFHYDFIQWSMPGKQRDPEEEAYLLTTDQGIIAGVVAFQNRTGEAGKCYWSLKWVWVAPKYRRRALLSNSWNILRSRYGNFYVEPPVSEAMKLFLEKKGELKLLDKPDAK